MTIAEFHALPETEKRKLESKRTCYECGNHLVGMKGHSTGDLHVYCVHCKMCPDCEEGE